MLPNARTRTEIKLEFRLRGALPISRRQNRFRTVATRLVASLLALLLLVSTTSASSAVLCWRCWLGTSLRQLLVPSPRLLALGDNLLSHTRPLAHWQPPVLVGLLGGVVVLGQLVPRLARSSVLLLRRRVLDGCRPRCRGDGGGRDLEQGVGVDEGANGCRLELLDRGRRGGSEVGGDGREEVDVSVAGGDVGSEIGKLG